MYSNPPYRPVIKPSLFNFAHIAWKMNLLLGDFRCSLNSSSETSPSALTSMVSNRLSKSHAFKPRQYIAALISSFERLPDLSVSNWSNSCCKNEGIFNGYRETTSQPLITYTKTKFGRKIYKWYYYVITLATFTSGRNPSNLSLLLNAR